MAKIMVTGPPRCGKTTLIKEVVATLGRPVRGFFTSEIREKGQRVGFEIQTFSSPPKRGVLSHRRIKSPYKVGSYGVDIRVFEAIALPELEAASTEDALVVIDEIGKMELFSERFKSLVTKLVDGPHDVLATIFFKCHPFCDQLKNLPEVKVLQLRPASCAETKEKILQLLRRQID